MASSSETLSSVRYGISSMLVQDKPAPVRISSVLTARHLLPRTKYPPRKYMNEGSMVPLFSNDDTPTTLKADALFIPRENPRALINFPMDQWPRKASEKASFKAGVEALLPKLRKSDYFTLPGINELAAKESAQPGFCSEVTDFIVGRHGYGSIKFFGATDVRWLDLDSIIQFNNYGVSVYKDDSKKPPVGQGLNKPAEITLLNIKCFDKQNELEYKEVLKSMAKNQGAEYVSYDATKGEWIFKVHHFSSYGNVFSFDHECSIRILGDRRKGDSFMKGSVTMGIETHSSFILCSKAMFDNFSQLRELGSSCPNIVLPTQVCTVDEEKYFVTEDLTLVQKYFSDKCAEFMEKEGRHEADYCNMEVKEKKHAIIRLWNTIEEDCYKFARDVTKGLAFLNTKKFLGCGNLNHGIFVRRKESETCDLKFRLLPSMKGNEAFSDDIRQLVGILLSIIFPPAWNFNSEANRNCPCTSIRNYISFLDSFGYLAGTEGVLCILDHPYIWTIPERVGYMTIIGKLRKFYNFEIVAIGRRLVDKYFDGDLIKWQELVRKNPLFNAILERANNINTHIPHYGGAYDDVFRFHVACYSHSNDVNFAAEKKAIGFLDAYISDETIDGLLNDIFPDFYDFLKYSTMTYKKPRMHASGRAKFRLNMLRGMNQIE